MVFKKTLTATLHLFLCISLSLLMTSFVWAQSSDHVEKKGGTVILENFQQEKTNEFPNHWYNRDGTNKIITYAEELKNEYKYTVLKENGNKFLRYEGTGAKHINFPLIDEDQNNIYDINIYETPILSWKVRAHQLPKNANEDIEARNDAVASVYVVFDMGRIALFKKVPKSIRYTWSTTLEEGRELSKLFGNQQIMVVKSGREDIGEWVTFEVNLVESYRRLFGDDPPANPMAILILSDGDSTGSFVKADYDDIMLKPE